MTRGLLFATYVAVISAGSVFAGGDCRHLCDAKFYTTATVADVREILDGGADVNARDDVGKTALHWVALASPSVVVALLAAGADVNARDQLERTPLHFVAAAGSVENIKLLIDAGADVNAKTANDWTPIHGAAKFGSEEQVMALLEAGADASVKTEMGETVFDFGSSNKKLADTEVLKKLEDQE
ncbi:ankyrin repeat domain-containing protein [Shimia aestuarii]|uniref:Ankyrin repeat-containing protein n=1 Tax=Shimia aestuarii TaxID=254406 RepID=A0A1I4MP96_9RHOB|nr:ankyrin repeat domain-containing protein [Shimia aestuarii]SFM05048.1 Ankyrin repeat-containing protein [Shimia aestuarii]